MGWQKHAESSKGKYYNAILKERVLLVNKGINEIHAVTLAC